MRYATTSMGDVYHLLAESEVQTICGRKVVPIVIDRPTETDVLHLVSHEPAEGWLCEECARSAPLSDKSSTGE